MAGKAERREERLTVELIEVPIIGWALHAGHFETLTTSLHQKTRFLHTLTHALSISIPPYM
jgi:hypothetical protein